jgi:hypothetical protein
MNGRVIAEGRAAGVSTPVSAAVVATVHAIERGVLGPALQNLERALRRAGV